MSTSERKEWRRIFTDTVMGLAQGRVDVLEAASWALEAQHLQGQRDPREVAREQFKSVDASPPMDPTVAVLTQALASSPEVLTRPDQSRMDTGAP